MSSLGNSYCISVAAISMIWKRFGSLFLIYNTFISRTNLFFHGYNKPIRIGSEATTDGAKSPEQEPRVSPPSSSSPCEPPPLSFTCHLSVHPLLGPANLLKRHLLSLSDTANAKAFRKQLKHAIYTTLFDMNVPAVCAVNQASSYHPCLCYLCQERVAVGA